MKKHLLLISAIILTSCQESTYDKIKDYLDTIEIVDAHEHLQIPADSWLSTFSIRFPTFPATFIQPELFHDPAKEEFNADSAFGINSGNITTIRRTTSYHDQLMYTLRILYGFNKPYLEKNDLKPLYEKMLETNYRNYPQMV